MTHRPINRTRPAVGAALAVAGLFAAAACSDNDDVTASATSSATTTIGPGETPSSTTFEAPIASSTTMETAAPPATNEDSDTAEPRTDLTGGPPIIVSPTAAMVGGKITITVECRRSDGQADVWFGRERAGGNEFYVSVPLQGGSDTTFQVVTVVPYWLEPGIVGVFGGCVAGVPNPEPATFEVLPSDLGVNAWQPLQIVWAEPDRVPAAAPPAGPSEGRIISRWGEQIRMHALCDAEIPVGGARFVAWRDAIMEPPFFYAVEFPVDSGSYDPVEGGVVISADVVIEREDFPSDNDRGPMRIDALCVDTPTPFVPDAVPDMPRFIVVLE